MASCRKYKKEGGKEGKGGGDGREGRRGREGGREGGRKKRTIKWRRTYIS